MFLRDFTVLRRFWTSCLNPFQGLVGVSTRYGISVTPLITRVSIPFRVWSVFLQKGVDHEACSLPRLNPFQGLVGVSTAIRVTFRRRELSLNPFQGLVGVSTVDVVKNEKLYERSQSLSGFGRCFYEIMKLVRFLGIPSQSLSGFGRCFYLPQGGF